MAKNYSVTFSILGNLDPSLLNALKSASDKIKSLGDLAKNISPKAASQARALQNARDVLKQVEAFNKLRGVMTTLRSAQAANLLLASRARSQQAAETKRLDEMRAAYQRLNDQFKANRRSMDAAARSAWHDNLKAARAEIKAQARLVDDLGKQELQHSAQATKLRAQLATQQNKLNQLRATLPQGVNTSAEAQLRAQIEQTTNALNQEIAALERRNQLFNTFNQRGQDLSNAWSNFQNSLSTAQTLLNPFAEAATNAMTYEKSLSRLKSLTQIRNLRAGDFERAAREVSMLDDEIQRLARTTEYFGNDIIGAANFYAMSGWTAEQIKAALPSTVDLASITQLPIARVADMFSDDMTAFGIKAGQSYRLAGGKVVDGAEYFNDAIAYATTQANLDFSTFHESWKYNAPTAKAMQLSLGETVAQNMMLANAGIKGSMSGTSLRQFWVRLSAPPKAAQKSLEAMGFAANDATQQIMNTEAAMEEAGVSMSSGLFEKIVALRNYYREGLAAGKDMTGWLKGLTGQTALSGVQALFDDDVLDKALAAAHEIDSGAIGGWAKETAAIMRDNTQTAVDYLKSAADAVELNMGKALTPAIRSAAEAFTPLVSSVAEFVAANPAIVQGCAAIAAELSGIIVSAAAVRLAFAGWGFITSTINLVRVSLAALGSGAMLSGLLGRLTALRTALFGLNGAATLGGWSAMFSAIALRATAARTAIVGFFASLSVSSMISGAVGALRSLGSAILGAARAAMLFALSPVGAALMALALAGLYCYQNWDKVGPVLSNIADTLGKVVSPAIDSVFKTFSTLGEALSPVSDILSTLANAVGGTLAGAFIGLLGTVASVVSGIIVLLAGLLKSVGTMGLAIAEAFEKIKSGDFSGAFDSLSKGASKSADDVAKAFDNAGKTIDAGLKATAEGLRELTRGWTLPTQEVVARHSVTFDETGAARSTPVDTSALQASVDNAASSMEQVSTPASGVATAFLSALFPAQMLTAALSSAAPATQQLGYSSLTAAASANAMGSSALMSVGSIGAMSTSADGSVGSIGSMAFAADGSTGSIGSMAGSADGASGSLGGLAGAVDGAISALYGAASRAGDAISSAASSAWSSIKSFVGVGGGGGGSFARGGLVEEPTFFAGEHGREMIIPLTEHHRRATNLWRAAGQMLGILPTTEGRKPDWSIKRVPRLPGGLKMPRINFPELVAGSQSLGASPQPLATSNQPLATNITINVTVNGNADEATVRRGVEQSLPKVRTFAEELGDWRREQLRRSFR